MTAVFVHLSDIHFGQEAGGGQRIINDDVRRQLIEDVAGVVLALPNKRASGIIVTGDIAYAGKQEEYDTAGKWLDELADRVGCAAADIQMVPGNHDIDRDSITRATSMMLEAIQDNGEAKLDEFLDADADRELLYRRFEAYRRFAEAYQCPLDCTGKSSSDRRVELADGRAIRFIRLNSALSCTKGRPEKGHLLLGARQRVIAEKPGEELVVLTHHPLSWYADSADTKKYLRGRARVFISAHEHVAAVTIEPVEQECDLMMLASGATTPDKANDKYNYAYNVIEFDWEPTRDALAITIHHRIWNDDLKRFEPFNNKNGEHSERTVLGSPNFRKAKRPTESDVATTIASTEIAPVEITREEDELGGGRVVDEVEYQNIYLRFFRDLTEGDRLRILVELDAIPPNLRGNFNHEMESRLLRSVVYANRAEELQTKIQEALGRQTETRNQNE